MLQQTRPSLGRWVVKNSIFRLLKQAYFLFNFIHWRKLFLLLSGEFGCEAKTG